MSAADVFGPGFPLLYASLIALATVAAVALRTGLRENGADAPDTFAPALHPIEIAYLSGGVTSATECAVASVRRRVLAQGDGQDRRTALEETLTHDVLPLEREIYAVVAQHSGAIERAHREADAILGPVRTRLVWLKLVSSEAVARRVQRWQLLLFAALLALGASALVADHTSAAPGTLPDYVVLSLLGAATWLLGRVRPTPPYRTRCGERLLDQLRAKHISLLWSLREHPHRLPARDYSLAVALFGARERAEGETYAAIVRIATRRTPSGVVQDSTPDAGSSA